MTKFRALCCIAALAVFPVSAIAEGVQSDQGANPEKSALKLVQTIPLPGVKGRLDHMGIDLDNRRLFVAATDNLTLEVVDLTSGTVNKSLTGFKDTQDAVFLGGNFNKL